MPPKEGEGACFPGPGGRGSWERSRRREECLPRLSSGASAESSAGLRLGPQRLPAGSPPGLQARRPVSVGASPPPVPQELGCVCGDGQAPLPGQLLRTLPAPAFHPSLKGKSSLPNSARPKPAAGGGGGRAGREGRGTQETLLGPPTRPRGPSQDHHLQGKDPNLGRRSAPGLVRAPPHGAGVLLP